MVFERRIYAEESSKVSFGSIPTVTNPNESPMFLKSDRQKRSLILFSVLFGGCLFSLAAAAIGQAQATREPSTNQATTWIIVRHAEREGNADKLSAAGESRARVLATLGDVLNVSAIYSTKTERTRNTVGPLADALDLEIRSYSRVNKEWINQLSEEHRGKVVLIVGHSNTTGVIAAKLAGTEPFDIGHDQYDSLFVVTANESSRNIVRLQYGPSSVGAASAEADKMAPK
jgi:broad specificity phosphatase PhoE